MRSVLVLLTIVFLAGCASPQSQEPPTATMSAAPTTSQSDIPATPVPAATLPGKMLWSDCIGLHSYLLWPSGTNPAPDFEGWGVRDPSDATELRHLILDCQRFSYGGFERGPIQFVFELSNERQPPQGCLDLAPTSLPFTVVGTWVSDPEIAVALAAIDLLPVGVATIAIGIDDSTGLRTARGEWTIDGSTSSLETHQESMLDTTSIAGRPLRIFWLNQAGGVSAVDFGSEVQGPIYPSERLVQGSLAPPMTAGTPAGAHVAVGFQFTASGFGGLIQRFGDLQCVESL